MSLHTLANHLQTAGRGEDKVLVHMTPGEVHGLQSLAMAHGGSLTVNPETGLPEAGFLSSILPIVAGLALGPAGAGIAFGGLGSAASAGLLVGGATAVATGSLKNGILAGLGAYGGAGLGAGLSGAAAAAPSLAGAASTAVPAAVGAGQALTATGLAGSPAALAGAAGSAAAAPVAANTIPGLTNTLAGGYAPIAPPSAAPVNAGVGAGQLGMMGGNVPPQLTIDQLAQQRAFAQQAAQAAPSKVLEEAAKSKGIFGGMDFAKLMNPDFIKENKSNYLAAMAPFLMEEERRKQQAEQAAAPTQYGMSRVVNPSSRAPGSTAERTYFADGGSVGQPIEQMSQANSVGANTNYPMANIKPFGYSVPKNYPVSQNVFQPDSYERVDPYTGEQQFAGGGIIALGAGGLGSVASKTPAKGAPAKAAPAAVVAAAKPKSAYTEPTSEVKGENLSALTKAYDSSINTQKAEMEKAKKALDAAKKTKKPSLIESAQDVYNKQANEYTQAQEYKNAGITAFKTETKRGAGLQARGYEPSSAADNAAIQKQIDAIKKKPAIAGGMTGASKLSAEQEKQIADLEAKKSAGLVLDPATGKMVADKTPKSYQKLSKAPGLDSTVKILEEKDIRTVFEEMAGRAPTAAEMDKYVGGKTSQAALAKSITDPKKGLAELQAAQKFTDDDLNQQAVYYWGREMTPGELKYFKNPANKVANFNVLRNMLTSDSKYLENLNKVNQAAFTSAQKAIQAETEGRASKQDIASYYQQVFNKPPSQEELDKLYNTGLNISALKEQLASSPEYEKTLTQSFVPGIVPSGTQPLVPGITQDVSPYSAQAFKPTVSSLQDLPISQQTAGVYKYDPFAVTPKMTTENPTIPYADVSQKLGLVDLYSQLGQPSLTPQKSNYGVPTAQSGLTAPQQDIFGFSQYPPGVEQAIKAYAAQQAAQQAPTGMASGGIAGYNLGGYSDGGRLLRGPGDGVSDSIPASIGDRQPARLADGEFVVPARIVSELGNGSTEAGARKLYAMMERVQKARSKTVGKGKVAVNSRSEKMLPA
jgi:hypothetical protein